MKTAIASVVAALGASMCCIGPLLLPAFGAGTLVAAAARLEAYRPIFLALTAVLVGAAFLTTHRRPRTDRCDDRRECPPGSRHIAKAGLWLVLLLVVSLVTFPYYVEFFV